MTKRDNITKVIKSSLSRLGKNNPGLVLLPAVTGMGKSYAAEQIAIEHINLSTEQKQWKRIFFITPRKDNLPISLLKHHNPERNKRVIFINNLQDNFAEHWDEAKKQIEELKLKIDKDLLERITRHLEDLTNIVDKTSHNSDYENMLKTNFAFAEQNFRRDLKTALKLKLGKDYPKLAKLSMYELQYQWIGKLYPAQIIEEADIVIMSARMAIGPLARVNGSANIDEFLEESLLILDEFDSIKTTMLDYVVEDANNHRYHLITTLRKLVQSLNAIEPPDIFPKSTQKGWDNLLNELNTFYEEKILRWHVKLSPELENAPRRFMASDYQFTTYISGHKSINLMLQSNSERKLHVIENNDKGESGQSLISLLVQCRILILKVAHTFRIAAEIRSKEKGNEYDFIFDEYFYSICNHFSLDNVTQRTLLSIVQKKSFLKYNSLFSEPFKSRTLVQKGLQLTQIIDSPRHSTLSHFEEISLYPIPEAIILLWCKKAQVLGMSATVLRETSIGNFHLDTLRTHLGVDRFITPNKDEHKLLEELHDELFAGYSQKKVETKIKTTDISQGSVEPSSALIKITGDREKAWQIFNLLKDEVDSIKGDSSDYFFARYLRIIRSLCYFCNHKEIVSALFILNAHPSDASQAAISSKIINDLFDILFEDDKIPFTIILKSKGFKIKLEEIDKKLLQGKRVIAFSTYSTIGKGVNIQHKIPTNFKTVKSNEYEESKRMDWQMVHLDAPTNLLPSLKYGEPFGVNNLKSLLLIEYFVLCGALPYTKTFSYFSAIFQNRTFEHPRHIEYYNFTIREVIQALGRLNRTNVKAPSIHILVENRLLDVLQHDPMTEALSIPEYSNLLKYAQEENGLGRNNFLDPNLQNDALNITLESEKKKTNLLKSCFAGNKKSIDTYKLLRETLLKHPVVDDIKSIPETLRSAYIKLPDELREKPSLYFKKANDRVINLNFQYDQDLSQSLSEETSGLKRLLSFNYIHDFFIGQGYATGFKPGTWIFNPSLFDIYKGALGEVTGKYLLEKFCGIALTELPDDLFEKFDFQTTGKKKIAIDFKFFQFFRNYSRKDFFDLLEKIDIKRSNGNFEKVFIINILSESKDDVFSVSTDDDYPNIIRVPFILKESKIEHKAINYLSRELK